MNKKKFGEYGLGQWAKKSQMMVQKQILQQSLELFGG